MFKRLRRKYEIKVLSLQPGDILILATEDQLSQEDCYRLKEQFAACTGINPVVLSRLVPSVVRPPPESKDVDLRTVLLTQKRRNVNLGLS